MAVSIWLTGCKIQNGNVMWPYEFFLETPSSLWYEKYCTLNSFNNYLKDLLLLFTTGRITIQVEEYGVVDSTIPFLHLQSKQATNNDRYLCIEFSLCHGLY
mmetsp:Transcript_14366/g.30161  ORF Transcript_14366/g.30161 Transcript_14366/m.30161 type:complete len:101 (-) Transcript_14366:325-627(-)